MICFIKIVLLACALLVAQAAGVPLKGENNGDDLTLLCTGHKKAQLTKLTQLNSLIELLDERAIGDDGGEVIDGKKDECNENIKSALRDLKQIVDMSSTDGCSLDGYERYEKYYKKYLDGSVSKGEDAVVLPEKLKMFALGVGLQLSELCRANMVRLLQSRADKAVSEEDNDEINKLVNPEGQFALSVGYDTRRPDDLMLLTDFMDMFQGRFESSLVIPREPEIERYQSLCRLRFKPVYSQLVIPVARFANLGFVERNKQVKTLLKTHWLFEHDHTKKYRDIVGRWTIIVFACEMLDGITLSDAPPENDDTSLLPEAVEKLKTAEEKAEMRTKQIKKKVFDNLDNLEKSTTAVSTRPLEELECKFPLKVNMRDEINVDRSYKKIKTDSKHDQRLRWSIFKRAYTRFFNNAIDYKVKEMFSDMFSINSRVDMVRMGQIKSELTARLGLLLTNQARTGATKNDKKNKALDNKIWTLILHAAIKNSIDKLPPPPPPSELDEQAEPGQSVDERVD